MTGDPHNVGDSLGDRSRRPLGDSTPGQHPHKASDLRGQPAGTGGDNPPARTGTGVPPLRGDNCPGPRRPSITSP